MYTRKRDDVSAVTAFCSVPVEGVTKNFGSSSAAIRVLCSSLADERKIVSMWREVESKLGKQLNREVKKKDRMSGLVRSDLITKKGGGWCP